jgi:hypothetical protein
MSQAFALFIAGLAALLLYAVQKQDLGVGTGLCALIWTVGGGIFSIYNKLFSMRGSDGGRSEVEPHQISGSIV